MSRRARKHRSPAERAAHWSSLAERVERLGLNGDAFRRIAARELVRSCVDCSAHLALRRPFRLLGSYSFAELPSRAGKPN